MKLLIERIETASPIIVEATDHKKSYFIEGIFLQANMRNQNGRIYPLATLQKEVNRYKIENIDRKRSLGELNHPKDSPVVNPERAALKIVSLEQVGNDFVGKAKILSKTPMGQIVAALIDEECELGVSSRGVGSIREQNGNMIVGEDYRLSAVDIVSDPSAPDAFVRGIMESKEWIFENGVLKECEVSELKEKFDSLHIPTIGKSVRKEVFTEEFQRFLTKAQSHVSLKIS